MRKGVIISLQPWIAEELKREAAANGLTVSGYITGLFLAEKERQKEIDDYLYSMALEAQKGTDNGN